MRNIIRKMRITPIDVQKLLSELRESGLSDERIGRVVGAPRATINRLRHGKHKTTGIDRAIKIANFHERHFAKRVAA